MQELKELLSAAPGADKVPESVLSKALAKSLVPDAAGNLPGTTDYSPTHDVYFAALCALGWLRALPQVTSAGSEGTSVTATPFDWDSLAGHFRSMSDIASLSDGFTVIPVHASNTHQRVNMQDGGYFDDRDTDIN